jgi:hypothetical protein
MADIARKSLTKFTIALELIEKHKQAKARMIAEEQKLHFSYDEAQKLTSIEKKANEILT